MDRIKKWLASLLVLFFFVGGLVAQGPTKSSSVILLIGDGMGPGVIGLGKYYNDFVLNKSELNIVKIMNMSGAKISLVVNYSASNLVTDSAAAATALATGHKTYNTAIGVDEKGNPLRSVLEEARDAGMMTGLITTCEAVDATPAGFSANASERANKNEIALSQIEKKVNLIMGGGAQYYLSLDKPVLKDYKIIRSKKDLKNLASSKNKFILGLFNEREMNYKRSRTSEEPSLVEMTKSALDFLDKNNGGKGFFLMVEGGRIDHAAHANSIEDLLEDFLEFDETIGVVLDYREKNPDTTFVYVTADHDTGGVSLTQRSKDYSYPTIDDLKELKGIYWTSKQHTSIPVIFIALTPTEQKYGGFIDNTQIYTVLKDAMRLR